MARLSLIISSSLGTPSSLIHCLFSLAGLGVRGDLVSVKKSLGRNQLLPQGLAVYASPENKKLFEEEKLVSAKEGRGTWRNKNLKISSSNFLSFAI